MSAPLTKFWLPPSHYSRAITKLNAALREYDERLSFVRNESNGDWVVAIATTDGETIPVLGFQNSIPEVHDMMDRLRAADTSRHTDWLEKEINAHNESIRQVHRDKADEAEWQVAEGMESFLHAQGKTPYARIYSKAVESRRTGGKS